MTSPSWQRRINVFPEVKTQGSPPRAEISLKSHISSKNVIEYFIPYHNISVAILISQNSYVNYRGVGSVFPEGAWDGFPCILNGVVITTSRVAVKIKGESCIWKCYVNCPPRTCIVLKKELRILSRRISRNLPALLSSWCFPHSQDEAGLSPGRTKECLWASQEAREIGIGTLIANLFKFLMIS